MFITIICNEFRPHIKGSTERSGWYSQSNIARPRPVSVTRTQMGNHSSNFQCIIIFFLIYFGAWNHFYITIFLSLNKYLKKLYCTIKNLNKKKTFRRKLKTWNDFWNCRFSSGPDWFLLSARGTHFKTHFNPNVERKHVKVGRKSLPKQNRSFQDCQISPACPSRSLQARSRSETILHPCHPDV